MAEDAKVDDGIRTGIKKGLKQLRKGREEARAAKELWEEMKENEEKAQERVWKKTCGERSMNTYIRGNKKVEDHTTSARKSGK